MNLKFYITLTALVSFTTQDCTSTTSPDKMCLSCNTANKSCTSCGGGFPEGLVCKAATTTVDNCFSYSANGTCSGCQGGYTLKGSVCIANPDDCHMANSSDTTKCVVCEPGKQINAEGVCETKACTTTNCQQCQSVTVATVTSEACVRCSSGYIMVGTACVSSTLTGCINGTSATNCSTCMPNYYWLSSNSNGTCVSYDQGYSSFAGLAVVGSLIAMLF